MFKFIGKPIGKANITGYLFPWYVVRQQPVLLFPKEHTSRPLLPVFSTEEKLREALSWMGIDGEWKIKEISEQRGFLNSVVGFVQVGVDPYLLNGNTRFQGVFLSDDLN